MSARLGLLALLVSLPSLLGVGGCDDTVVACTLIGCEDALHVDLTPAGGALAAGRYSVSATGAGDPFSCAFTVSASGEVADESASCRGVFRRQDEPGGVTVIAPPLQGRVTVEVVRDGALVARQQAEAVYRGVFPNGPDCGAACQSARVVVVTG